MSNLSIALSCIARGWYVFPCVPNEKEPLKGVPGYKAGTLDEKQVRAWWMREPQANPAMSPGKSGLVVLDIDKGLRDEADLRAFMAAHELPETYAVRTGSRPEYKVQLYYIGDGVDTFNHWEYDGHGGDVRGSTWGHVMVPGCIHPSGAIYEVLWDKPFAPVPNFVRALKPVKKEREALTDPNAPIVEWRNDTLYRVLCKHRANGADDEMIRDFALRKQAGMPNPLDEEELETIITNACKQPIGLPEPVAILGTGKTEPGVIQTDTEDAEELSPAPRPKYPDDVWDGTPYGEFANLCTRDNYVPKKFFTESIRTVVGAVVGNQLTCSTDGTNSRAYTILITSPGGGKGTACERVMQLFKSQWEGLTVSVEPPLLFGKQELFWRGSGLGAQIVNPASAPGLMKALEPRKLKKGEVADPRETWRPLPRFITIMEEVRGLFANFQNESTGAGLESVLCELFDRESFSTTATKDRQPDYGELMYSLLGGITPEGWSNVFSKVESTESGFLSRVNIIGSEEARRVSDLEIPDFSQLRNRFFPLIKDLAANHRRLSASPDAKTLVAKWFKELTLPDGVSRSRLNIHAWRTALHIAWLRGHEQITAQDGEAGTRVADYQVRMREFYAPPEGETRQARCEAAIRKAMRARRRMKERDLKRATHYEKYGVDLWDRSLTALCKAGEIRRDKDARPRTVILLKNKE